ncbi:hypothetical protein GGE62_005069 [Rhizobium leguminosarum]|nr:hypothetical protein [Rhizobium leguminosarum]
MPTGGSSSSILLHSPSSTSLRHSSRCLGGLPPPGRCAKFRARSARYGQSGVGTSKVARRKLGTQDLLSEDLYHLRMARKAARSNRLPWFEVQRSKTGSDHALCQRRRRGCPKPHGGRAHSEGLQEGAGHQQCQLLECKPGVSLPGDDVFVAPFAERNLPATAELAASCLYSKPRQTPQSHHLRWG